MANIRKILGTMAFGGQLNEAQVMFVKNFINYLIF